MALSSGNLLSPDTFMGFFRMDFSSYMGLARNHKDSQVLIGRIYLNMGDEAARLAYLAPQQDFSDGILEVLLNHLAWECGSRGALRLLSELDENAPAFESFRLAGFCVYTRQQIWKISAIDHTDEAMPGTWQILREVDLRSVQNLYHAVVPPLVQGAECMDKRQIRGYGYYLDEDLLAFVEVIYGAAGIFVNPVVHPNLRKPLPVLTNILSHLQQRSNRPLYLAVRDYQSWLNGTLQELQAIPGERKVMMVKHLAHRQRVSAMNPIRAVLDVPGPETSSPYFHRSENKK